MKKIIFLLLIFIGFGLVYFFGFSKKNSPINPLNLLTPSPKPLLTYTFDNLKKTQFPKSNITLDHPYSKTENTTSQLFFFKTPRSPNSGEMDTVSGLMNIPKKAGTYPVIVMLRGFVPDDMYAPGVGTEHVAEALAQHGYITLAPDFLGFGYSSPTSKDSFESRFQTYTTAATLLQSLSTLNEGLQASYSGTISADLTKVGIWGHSNGGHIALSLLAISGVNYPTVLWAPVSKSFPYSILFYSDEADDHGKALRNALANFEKNYDADLFSPLNYYQWIKAPISIHQGINDHEVPEWWSNDLASILKKDGVQTSYHVYDGDHNMIPSWSTVVNDSISFFDAQLSAKDLHK